MKINYNYKKLFFNYAYAPKIGIKVVDLSLCQKKKVVDLLAYFIPQFLFMFTINLLIRV